MIDHAMGQHTLPSLAKSKGKKKQVPRNDGMVQTQLSFGQKPKIVSQLKRLREMAMERLGLSYSFYVEESINALQVLVSRSIQTFLGSLAVYI
jgi:hypothetical protein